MIGQFDVPDDVLLTACQFGKDRSQQIFAAKPLQRRRDLLTEFGARDLERPGCIPAPPILKDRHDQHRLFEHRLDVSRGQHGEHAFQRETVLRAKRQHDPVVIGVGLQFKIERPAKSLAHGQAPGPRNTRSERGMNHQLHPATFVEEPLKDDATHRRQQSDRCFLSPGIFDRLVSGFQVDFGFKNQPVFCGLWIVQSRFEIFSQSRHFFGQFVRTTRCLAAPERDCRGSTPRIRDEQIATAQVSNPPGRVSQQEDITRLTLGAKVFIDRADHRMVFFRDNTDRKDFGDRSPIGDGRHSSTGSRSQPATHLVVMQKHPATLASRSDPFAQDLNDPVELASRQIPVGGRPAHQCEQFVSVPFLARHFGDDLLGQYVERGNGNRDDIESTCPNGSHDRHALEQFVSRQCEQPSFRNQPQRVS